MNSLIQTSCRKIVAHPSLRGLGSYNLSPIVSEKFIPTVCLVLRVRTQLVPNRDHLNYLSVRRINLSFSRNYGAQSSMSSCWKCGTVIVEKLLFCESCSVVQKPKNLHHFDIIGVSKSFNVDTLELTKNFRQLQSQLHPDKFTQKSKDEKKISEEYSMLLNTAYKTLLSPIERGLYLLELEGYPLLEGEIMMSPEFLYEVMEINEELDDIDNLEDLQHFKETNNLRLENMLKEVETLFEQQDWNSARKLLGGVKYFANVQEKIKEKEVDIVS